MSIWCPKRLQGCLLAHIRSPEPQAGLVDELSEHRTRARTPSAARGATTASIVFATRSRGDVVVLSEDSPLQQRSPQAAGFHSDTGRSMLRARWREVS